MGTEDYFSRRDWEALTRRDFKADGLLRYCSKLEALGSIVEFMGFNEDGELLLQGVKDNLGDIISDYAKTIKKGLNELYPVMCRFYKYVGTSLMDRANAVREATEQDPENLVMSEIEKTIEEIQRFLDNDYGDLVRMLAYFKKVAERGHGKNWGSTSTAKTERIEDSEKHIDTQREKAYATSHAA